MPLLIVLLVLVGLNIWITRRIIGLGDAMGHKGMHIAMVWMVPLVGALMGHAQARAHEQAARAELPVRNGVLDAPPALIEAPGAENWVMAHGLQLVHGYPLMDWRAFEAWLAPLPPAAQPGLRLAAHRAWLLHMRDALGAHVSLRESEAAWVLSSLEPASAEAVAAYVARTRGRIERVLGPLARFPAGMKSIVLVLDHEDDYYHYVAAHDPGEGEAAFSGGMFIDAGCPHFVLCRAELRDIEPVIAHELTHSALAHLRQPVWLDEGLAVNTEHRVAGARPSLHTPHALHAMHVRFWNEETIQQFWSGESFRRTDDGNLLSYDLARLVVSQLSSQWSVFQAFVADARRADAGEAAAARHFELSLGRYVGALFGHQDADAWSPSALAGS